MEFITAPSCKDYICNLFKIHSSSYSKYNPDELINKSHTLIRIRTCFIFTKNVTRKISCYNKTLHCICGEDPNKTNRMRCKIIIYCTNNNNQSVSHSEYMHSTIVP